MWGRDSPGADQFVREARRPRAGGRARGPDLDDGGAGSLGTTSG